MVVFPNLACKVCLSRFGFRLRRPLPDIPIGRGKRNVDVLPPPLLRHLLACALNIESKVSSLRNPSFSREMLRTHMDCFSVQRLRFYDKTTTLSVACMIPGIAMPPPKDNIVFPLRCPHRDVYC